MDTLLKALTIFLKYGNPEFSTHCEHDKLTVDIDPALVSAEDLKKLDDLYFHAQEDEECFTSSYFGSC